MHIGGSLAVNCEPQAPGVCTVGSQEEASHDHLHPDEPGHLDGEDDLWMPEMLQHSKHGFRLQLAQDLESKWKAEEEQEHSRHAFLEEAPCSSQQTGSWRHAKCE